MTLTQSCYTRTGSQLSLVVIPEKRMIMSLFRLCNIAVNLSRQAHVSIAAREPMLRGVFVEGGIFKTALQNKKFSLIGVTELVQEPINKGFSYGVRSQFTDIPIQKQESVLDAVKKVFIALAQSESPPEELYRFFAFGLPHKQGFFLTEGMQVLTHDNIPLVEIARNNDLYIGGVNDEKTYYTLWFLDKNISEIMENMMRCVGVNNDAMRELCGDLD